MKKLVIYLLLTMGWSALSQGQTLEEYRRQQDSAREAMGQDRDEYMQQYTEDFNRFVEERDKEFAEMLRDRFREIELSRALQPDRSPKPTVIPAYPPDTTVPANEKIDIDTTTRSLGRSRSLLFPIPTEDNGKAYSVKHIQLSFYGASLTLPYDARMLLSEVKPYDAQTLSEAWLYLSNTHLTALIHSLYHYKNQMNLNDWGYYQLIRQFTEQLYPSDDPRIPLTTWFLLNKSRYKAKIGYTNQQLFLLLPTNCTVYATNYYTFGEQTYYAMGNAPQSLYTYTQDYAGADLSLDLDLQHPLNLGGTPNEKALSFHYGAEDYQVQVEYNPRAIQFYQDYPEVDLRVKLESTLSREAKESLIAQFQPLLQDRTPADAVAMLLRFVQTAFEYQLDEAQFGQEKYFFPEEMFHYAYSDCEDRSALFIYLVRQLLGLKVMGLQYPGHVATAVSLTNGEGEFVEQDGEKFIICDPTYVNAPVGKVMPRYAKDPVAVVQLRDPYQQLLTEMIWEIASVNGVYPGANHHNVVMDAMNNIYFVGYKLSAQVTEGQNVYLAKLAPNGKILWDKTLTGIGNDLGQYLAIDQQQQVYLAGRYENELQVTPDITLATSASGFFVAKFTPNGQLSWARDIPAQVENLEHAFAAKISERGELLETLIFDDAVAERGMALDGHGFVYFSEHHDTFSPLAPAAKTRGLAPETAASDLDMVETLKSESDRLQKQAYEPAIAGLFAVIHCIMQNGIIIEGTAALKALDRYNPTFRKDCPEIYANIAKLRFMKNESGVITIVNEAGGNVDFNKMRIHDNAQIRLRTFTDGNAQVDVLSGITVGKAFVRFKLNHVKLFKTDGNLLFDYDNDNTQLVMNLREDILY
ncbi:MAG: hypothetical protein RIG62_31200 [Cyclobacteriaceae bacterium]